MRLRINRIADGGMKMVFVATCLIVLWAACNAGNAQAHAILLQTDPPSGSQINESPDKVFLAFNERVETIFNSIQVLDQDGRRVDVGDPQVVGDGDTLEVGLKNLGKGQYTVRWRVNSLDGHQVQGYFGFGVNSPPPTEAAMNKLSVPEQSKMLKFSLLLVKWTGLVAMVTWLGGVSFWIMIFEPSMPIGWGGNPSQRAVVHAAIQATCRILCTAAGLFLSRKFLR